MAGVTMGVMAVFLTIGIFAGFGLLMYGVFFQKSTEHDDTAVDSSGDLERIKISVEEADNTLSNINSVSSLVIEEIDIKYKELLFLYQMLEDKKKEMLEQSNTHEYEYGYEPSYGSVQVRAPIASAYEKNLEILEISRKMDEVKKFPKVNNREEILNLDSQGYDITGIAKKLGMGKGEVKLILGLNKVGTGYD